MQSSLSTPTHKPGSAISGPKSANGRRARQGLSAAVIAGGLLAVGPVMLTTPAFAQLKPADSVETAFGRAPLTFADIIQKVKPSVVSVSVVSGGNAKMASKDEMPGKGKGKRGLPEGMPDIPKDSPLYDFFFKNMPKGDQQQEERPSQAQGSGFVISPDGYVVTNNHVVEGATKIQISFDDQEKYDAELIGTDSRTDLALLKIQSSKTFPVVKLSTTVPRVGDWALAVGNPFGLGGTVTAGIVSALARDINPGPYEFIQIDAAVNKGNSGGPTFNLSGEVMGVNTAIFSPSGGNVGIAFAIPAKTVNDVVEQLKKTGSVSRGWLGVKIQNVDEDTSAALGLTENKGALVSEITANGPAAGSGLKVQDTILQVNSDKISDSKDLARKIAELAPDATVELKVWRGGGEQTVKVKLGKFPGSSDEIAKLEQGQAPDDDSKDEGVEVEKLGMKLAPAKASNGGDGVTIADVANNSDAAEKGLKAGDVILSVDGVTVSSPQDVVTNVDKVASDGKKAVMFYVKTAEQKRIVPLRFGKKG